MGDDKYIRMRKRKAQRLSALFLLMQIFPVKKHKIVFSSFEGDGGFCCNPRYIAEELHKRNDKYEMVWLTHDTGKSFPPYIKAVKDTSVNTAFHLSTAKVWVDNYRKPYGTLKRKGQYYIQTWHATIGFKAVGLFRGDKLPEIARIVSEADSALIDCMIINSEYCRKIYPLKLMYDGYMLKAGSPRVDCLINDKNTLQKEIREKFSIPGDTKIVMYAPTFRGGTQSGKKEVVAETPSLDFNMVLTALQDKFGGEWYLFLRLHPQLAAKMTGMLTQSKDGNRIIDVSQEDDMSQVLGACDVLITDYSSCAFDAAFAGIPVFLYADDINEYIENRGQFMWKREELPFEIAEKNEMLINNIYNYDHKLYMNMVHAFMTKHDIVEDGYASERVATEIERVIFEKNLGRK